MRTFAVLALFLCSLLGLGATLSAEASNHVVIQPGLDAPSLMEEGALAGGKKDGGRDDEESEEDFARGDHDLTALDELDRGALESALRLRMAIRR